MAQKMNLFAQIGYKCNTQNVRYILGYTNSVLKQQTLQNNYNWYYFCVYQNLFYNLWFNHILNLFSILLLLQGLYI